jgi:hypothetical protein
MGLQGTVAGKYNQNYIGNVSNFKIFNDSGLKMLHLQLLVAQPLRPEKDPVSGQKVISFHWAEKHVVKVDRFLPEEEILRQT